MADEFGLEGSLGHEENIPEFLADEPQVEDKVEEEAPAEEELFPGRDERPRGPDGRFLPKEEEKPEETPAETPTVYAGKYQDVPALEKGYRELRELQRRTAERANAYEQRVAEVEFQARQMEQSVQQATQYVRSLEQQASQQMQPQTVYDEVGRPIQLPPQGLSPEQVQELVAAQTNEAMALQAQAIQQQQWRQAKYQEAQSAQSRFFEAHPEVVKDSDVDEDIASTIMAFNEAWQPMDGSTFNLGSEESLSIAYEASKRPALRTVLMKQPALMDDDEGMTLARALANQIDNGGTTQNGSPVQGRMTAQSNTPFAERGSSPAPPQASPLDEFDQAVADYRKAQKAHGSDVFFGGE